MCGHRPSDMFQFAIVKHWRSTSEKNEKIFFIRIRTISELDTTKTTAHALEHTQYTCGDKQTTITCAHTQRHTHTKQNHIVKQAARRHLLLCFAFGSFTKSPYAAFVHYFICWKFAIHHRMSSIECENDETNLRSCSRLLNSPRTHLIESTTKAKR